MAAPRIFSEGGAIGAIQEYYLTGSTGTVRFALSENPNSILEYKITRVGEKAIGKLSLLNGAEEDWNRLNALKERLQEEYIPVQEVNSLGYKTLLGGRAAVSEDTFSMTPKLQRTLSGKELADQFSTQFPPSYSPSRSSLEQRNSTALTGKGKKSDAIEISGKVISSPCTIREEKQFYVRNSTFEGALIVRKETFLEKVIALDKAICRQGPFQAKNSQLNVVICQGDKKSAGDVILIDTSLSEIEAEKGKVSWKNDTLQKAEAILAGKEIELVNVSAKEVTSQAGAVIARKCNFGKVKVLASISFEETKAEMVHVTLGASGACELILKENSSIHQLVIEELQEAIDRANREAHSVTGFPPSFNFPNKKTLGVPLEGASGRLEGKPHQYLNGKFIEGVKVVIRGGTIRGDVVFKNCKGHLLLSEGASHMGKIVQKGSS